MTKVESKFKGARWFIVIVSILIPAAIAALYLLPKTQNISPGTRAIINVLPTFNATVNGTAFFLLIFAFMAIRKGKIKLHKLLMSAAVLLSALFLMSYVVFHGTTEGTKFQGEGVIRIVYFSILISHIVTSAVIVPFVLITYVRGLTERFDKHKKIARITWPLWLYVTFTRVVVYMMISTYYSF